METKEAISRLQTLLDTEISLKTKQAIAMGIESLKTNLKEQPEVDLEEEIDRYCEPIQAWQVQEAPFTSLEKCARHFYELGLNARKEK